MKPEIIDWNRCLELANHKPELAQEILSLAMTQFPKDIDLIRKAYFEKDFSELLKLVHKLHGALCYTGLPRLKNVTSHLEKLLKKKNFTQDEVGTFIDELECEMQSIRAISTSALN